MQEQADKLTITRNLNQELSHLTIELQSAEDTIEKEFVMDRKGKREKIIEINERSLCRSSEFLLQYLEKSTLIYQNVLANPNNYHDSNEFDSSDSFVSNPFIPQLGRKDSKSKKAQLNPMPLPKLLNNERITSLVSHLCLSEPSRNLLLELSRGCLPIRLCLAKNSFSQLFIRLFSNSTSLVEASSTVLLDSHRIIYYEVKSAVEQLKSLFIKLKIDLRSNTKYYGLENSFKHSTVSLHNSHSQLNKCKRERFRVIQVGRAIDNTKAFSPPPIIHRNLKEIYRRNDELKRLYYLSRKVPYSERNSPRIRAAHDQSSIIKHNK